MPEHSKPKQASIEWQLISILVTTKKFLFFMFIMGNFFFLIVILVIAVLLFQSFFPLNQRKQIGKHYLTIFVATITPQNRNPKLIEHGSSFCDVSIFFLLSTEWFLIWFNANKHYNYCQFMLKCIANSCLRVWAYLCLRVSGSFAY